MSRLTQSPACPDCGDEMQWQAADAPYGEITADAGYYECLGCPGPEKLVGCWRDNGCGFRPCECGCVCSESGTTVCKCGECD